MSEPTTTPAATPPKKSRKGLWIGLFLAMAVVMVIGVGLLFLVFVAGLMGAERPTVHRGSVLEIDLSRPLSEGPPAIDLSPFLVSPGSVWELRRGLLEAAKDPDIAAIQLSIHNAFLGWGVAEEVLQLLDDFRQSGKPVYVLLEADMVSDLDYFLATAGDRIFVTPEVGSLINGLVAEAQFLRGTLEKLHVEPQVIMYKEFKSAGETYANYSMSEAMRIALEAVLATVHDRFLTRVTERRPISRSDLEALMSRGIATGPDLLEAGLVDSLGYRDQIRDAFEELSSVDDYRGISLPRYLRSRPERTSGRQRIAVVFGEGAIVAENVDPAMSFFAGTMLSGPQVAKQIRAAAEDERVKAIVFRVNSPGGSAVGSDLVRREIERAQDNGKPVIVSMSDVAGSGGYWVAMDADAIVSQPTTITGSIGVVFTKFNMDGFYEWIGTGVDRVSTAPNANLLGFSAWEEGQEEAVRSWMDRVYESFTEGVARGRSLELDDVLDIARGRIWSGRDALDKKLVDRLGGLDTAIAIAKERAGIDADRDVSLVVYPRPRTLFQQLMEDGLVRSQPTLPSRTDLADWARRLSRAQVRVQMPDLFIH